MKTGAAGLGTSAVELHGLTKRFGEVCAVSRVDLAIEHGEIFGLIGPNGAGKSTLFKLMLGLLAPTDGRVRIEGREARGAAFRDIRRRIGYLPENVVLWDNLTGLETLAFFARLKGTPAAACRGALEAAGIAHAGKRRVRTYSKGMRQRLGLAQALLGEPALLFLDEPTAGLDPESRRGFYALLDSLRARGSTIVITSHVLAELQDKVDRIAILREGSLAALGAVAELQRSSGLLLRVDFRANNSADSIVQALRSEGFAPQALADGGMRLALPASRRMALLSALAPFFSDLEDLRIREPSLEEVFLAGAEAAQ